MLDERAIAIQAIERLGWSPSARLRVQSMIPAALSNLAKAIAKDPTRRPLLQTDPATVELALTAGIRTSTTSGYSLQGSVDLSSIIETYGVMLDYIRNGTVFFNYQVPFSSTDVTTGLWPTGGFITPHGGFADGALLTGATVNLTTTGVLPTGVTASYPYFIIADEALHTYAFALTLADAEADTGVTLSGAGSGNSVINTPTEVVQWLMSPSQGSLDSCLPFSYATAWLQGTTMYVKGLPVNGSTYLAFNVPFTPTSATFPDDEYLYSDLLDTLVAVCATMGIEDTPPTNAN